MASWLMEVQVQEGDAVVWKPVRGTGAVEPYRYQTKEAAEAMLRICYPDVMLPAGFSARVREVPEEPNQRWDSTLARLPSGR